MRIARYLALLLFTLSALAATEDRIRGWIDAYNSGSADAMEAFAQANYTPEALARRTPAERRTMFERLQSTHGKFRVTSMDADSVTVEPERGEPLTLNFTMDPAPPHRIVNMGIRIGGGEERMQLPPVPLSSLDEYINKLPDFSGTVLVAKNGEIQFEKAYGLASKRYNIPNKITTRYNVGSITKDFTKVAIGQLAQAGKLKLDVPILTYLPNYPNKDAAQKITIQQLVDHTSGLGDLFTPRFFERNNQRFRSLQDYIEFFASDPLQFEPGKGQSYSNYGYVVLGSIIEAVSGESYFDYIHKHVFDPAGMSGSGFFDPQQIVPDVATGHTHRTPTGDSKEWLERNAFRAVPAGGSYSTARDLLLFDRALRGKKLLNEEWTRWWYHGEAGPWVGAGGSPGVNGAIASDPTWTVVVLTNIDPPLGETFAEKLWTAVTRVTALPPDRRKSGN